MKIVIKSLLIFSLSVVYSYSACNFKAKLGTKKNETDTKPLDVSKPITLDFLTNPDKE